MHNPSICNTNLTCEAFRTKSYRKSHPARYYITFLEINISCCTGCHGYASKSHHLYRCVLYVCKDFSVVVDFGMDGYLIIIGCVLFVFNGRVINSDVVISEIGKLP